MRRHDRSRDALHRTGGARPPDRQPRDGVRPPPRDLPSPPPSPHRAARCARAPSRSPRRRAVRRQRPQAQLKKDSRRPEGRDRRAQRPAGRPVRGDPQTTVRAQGHQRRPRRVKVKITEMQARSTWSRPTTTPSSRSSQSLDAQLVVVRRRRSPRRPSSPSARPCSPSASERLRHRPHLAPRVLPVGRDVHRPAGRDELLHRRRRAGQGARRPDRHDQETLAALHQTTEDTRDADQRPAPGDGRPEARPRREPGRAQGRQGGSSSKLEKRTAATLAASRSGPTPRLASEQGRRRGDHRARPPPRRSGCQDRSTSSSASRSSAATSRRSSTARCAGRWTADVTQNFGCTGVRVRRRPATAAPTIHNGIDLVGPERHAGPARPAPGPSSTSAGTRPTAPTRPGS